MSEYMLKIFFGTFQESYTFFGDHREEGFENAGQLACKKYKTLEEAQKGQETYAGVGERSIIEPPYETKPMQFGGWDYSIDNDDGLRV